MIVLLIYLLGIPPAIWARGCVKNWFIERFAITSTILSQEEVWGQGLNGLSLVFCLFSWCYSLGTLLFLAVAAEKSNPHTNRAIRRFHFIW